MTPRRFNKKPITIEAMQLTGTADETMEVFRWVERNTLGTFEPLNVLEGTTPPPESGISIDPTDGSFLIATLEGIMRASRGDWIIRGVQGEFYACKPDIFNATYEEHE